MFSFLKENAQKVEESSGMVRRSDRHCHTVPVAEATSETSKLYAANLPKVSDGIDARSSSTLTSVTDNLSSKSKLDASFPMESKTKSSVSTSDHVTPTSDTQIHQTTRAI